MYLMSSITAVSGKREKSQAFPGRTVAVPIVSVPSWSASSRKSSRPVLDIEYPNELIGPGRGDLFGQYDTELQSWVMTTDPDTIISPWTDYDQLWQSNDTFQGRAGKTFESIRWPLVYRSQVPGFRRVSEVQAVQQRKDRIFDGSMHFLMTRPGTADDKGSERDAKQERRNQREADRNQREGDRSRQDSPASTIIDVNIDDTLQSNMVDESFGSVHFDTHGSVSLLSTRDGTSLDDFYGESWPFEVKKDQLNRESAAVSDSIELLPLDAELSREVFSVFLGGANDTSKSNISSKDVSIASPHNRNSEPKKDNSDVNGMGEELHGMLAIAGLMEFERFHQAHPIQAHRAMKQRQWRASIPVSSNFNTLQDQRRLRGDDDRFLGSIGKLQRGRWVTFNR